MNRFRITFGAGPTALAAIVGASFGKADGVRKTVVAASSALALAGSLMLIPGAAHAAAPGPRFGDNYRLAAPETPGRGRDATGLTVDPNDPNHIVEMDGDPTNLQCDYHVSFDGGRTWSGGHLTNAMNGENPPFPAPACDQNYDSGGYHHSNSGIVFGSGQNVYITFSVHRGDFNRPESAILGGNGDDAMVARSTDGGRTFAPAVVATPGGGPVGTSNLAGFGMRPRIAVQRGAGSGGQDRLYVVTWNCYTTGGCSGDRPLPRRIYVVRSDDGGTNWSPRFLVSKPGVHSGADATSLGTTDEQARELSPPVIGPGGPNGIVYVAYRNRDATEGSLPAPCPAHPNSNPPGEHRNCIIVARSSDLGQTWQWSSTGVPLGGAVSAMTGQGGSGGGHPGLAIDPSNGAQGTLYVAYNQDRRPSGPNDSSDIFFQRSTDSGVTWTPNPPIRVNDDTTTQPQTNGWPTVGPGGRVDVTWADRRLAYPGAGTIVDIYTARSTDSGLTFGPSRRVTDRSINTGTGRFGDYGTYTWYGPVRQELANGDSLTAWMDSREGNLDSGFQDIYLSRLEGSVGIGKRTVATASPSGLSVTLSRLAYPGGPEAAGALVPATKLVVANQGDLPATLAGAVLARASWGSLLLSPAGGLPAVVKADATRMRPEGGFVIGDTSTLSPQVSSDLRDATRNGENVSRVAPTLGVPVADRPAEIARQIAELLRPLPVGTGGPEAVIANPGTPEAASASALAASLKLPILFVDSRSTVPGPTSAAITSLGIKKLLIVGGTGSVNATVATNLGLVPGVTTVTRVNGSGAEPYSTSEAVLNEAKTRGLPANVVYVADGARPIDGALLGAAVGRLNGLMLFTHGASTDEAEARLGAIPGFDTAMVDRLAGAVGAGGSDPVVPASPSGGLTSSGTTSTTTAGSTGAAADTTAPGVSRFGVTNSPFAVGGRTPTFGFSAAKKHKKGTTFTYTLSEAATARIVISQRRPGRRQGIRCVAPRRSLRKKARCTIITRKGELTRVSHQGANRVAFSGRIGSKALSPGSYSATITATDAAKNTSGPKTISFTIAKR